MMIAKTRAERLFARLHALRAPKARKAEARRAWTLETAAFAAAFAAAAAFAPGVGSTAWAKPEQTRAASAQSAPITREEVIAAQNAWGEALVAISTMHQRSGVESARSKAAEVIDSAYGYTLGPVLFKPTLTTAPHTFRTTRAGALSYFVGGDPAFAGDTGFALKEWRSYEVENAAIFLKGDVAISTGKVRLTNQAGAVTEVDKTWGWTRGADGKLRIVLHHSSLPYAPN